MQYHSSVKQVESRESDSPSSRSTRKCCTKMSIATIRLNSTLINNKGYAMSHRLDLLHSHTSLNSDHIFDKRSDLDILEKAVFTLSSINNIFTKLPDVHLLYKAGLIMFYIVICY